MLRDTWLELVSASTKQEEKTGTHNNISHLSHFNHYPQLYSQYMVFTVTPAHVGVSALVKNMSKTFSVNIIIML